MTSRHRPAKGYYIQGTGDDVRYFNSLRNRWGKTRCKHARFPSYQSALGEVRRLLNEDLNPDHFLVEIVDY